MNKDLPEVSPKKQYHVILPCDGRIYHEWQARVVRCCELYLVYNHDAVRVIMV